MKNKYDYMKKSDKLALNIGKHLYKVCLVPMTDNIGQEMYHQKDGFTEFPYHDDKGNLCIGKKFYKAGEVRLRHIQSMYEYESYYGNQLNYAIKLIQHAIKRENLNHFVFQMAKNKILRKNRGDNHDKQI